jgi:hypothetical protein
VLTGQTSPTLNVLGDAAFVTAATGSGIVQYKVNVIETTGLGSNPSEFTITLPILRQGVNSVVGVLTNESQTVATDSNGVVPLGTVIRSTLVIYNGISDDSANWTASITALTSGITATLINGKTIDIPLPLNTDNGTVEITASRQGYPNIVKVFSVSKARAGYVGEDGINTAVVYAYQRASALPSTNPGIVEYSFTSNTITTTTLANGWSKTLPSGTLPLYVVAATAASATETDSIAAAEWSAPVLLAQNGVDGDPGLNGLNVATVYLYARNNSTTTAPTLSTTGSATYTYSTRALSGTIPSGWSSTIPDLSVGSVIWISQATASSSTTTDSIANTEWSTPRVLAQKGDVGASTTAYELVVSAPVIVKTASNLYSPASITVSATTTTGTSNPTAYSGRFRILEDGVVKYTSSTDQSSYTFTPTTTSVGIIKVELYLAGGTTTLLDSQEVPITVAGSSGITISVANQAHVLPSDAAGAVATYTGSGTTIQVFEGATALTYLTTLGTAVSSFTIGTPTLSVANSITVGARSGNGTTTATVAQHSLMANATNAVVITYPITYNRANGAQATEFVTQSLSKALAGTIGVRGSRSLYDTSASYTSTYDFDGAGATLPGGPSYAARATQLIASAVAGSTPTTPINGDTVTFSNGTDYVYTITHNGTSWVPPGTIIDGSLLVTGSVTASKINSNGLEVRSPTGELILGSGSALRTQIYTNTVNLIPSISGWIFNGGTYLFKGNPNTVDKCTIVIPSGQNYTPAASPQLNLSGLGGVFRISFKAYTPAARLLIVDLFPDTLLETQVTLTPGWNSYSYTWSSTDANLSNCSLRFFAGTEPYQIEIGDVQLEVGSVQTSWQPSTLDIPSVNNKITESNASTYIANAAIGSAQIGSISLVGTSNFSVKSGTAGARMEMDSRAIKVFDANDVKRVQLGDLTI